VVPPTILECGTPHNLDCGTPLRNLLILLIFFFGLSNDLIKATRSETREGARYSKSAVATERMERAKASKKTNRILHNQVYPSGEVRACG